MFNVCCRQTSLNFRSIQGLSSSEYATTRRYKKWQLAKSKYYVEETVAPEGYNINSKKFEITISTQGIVTGDNVTTDIPATDNVKDNKLVVTDFPLSVPQTGGAGTVMFTVGGIALIACAGVLFFVVMRKKKTSK